MTVGTDVGERDADAPARDREQEDRKRYDELLNEFRVILPGVQVLFAFLLTVPFASQFAELDDWGRTGFAIALGASAVTVILFLTPTAFHHLSEDNDRRARIQLSIRLKIAGIATLGIAVSAGIFVVTRFVFGLSAGLVCLVAVTVLWLVAWFALPFGHRVRG